MRTPRSGSSGDEEQSVATENCSLYQARSCSIVYLVGEIEKMNKNKGGGGKGRSRMGDGEAEISFCPSVRTRSRFGPADGSSS